MRSLRKMVIVLVMVSTLAACDSKKTEVEVTSSAGPTAQPTTGATSTPSQQPTGSPLPTAASPTPTVAPTPQPQTTTSPKPTPSPAATAPKFSTAAEAKKVIEARAQEVINAMKEKSIATLAALVHPQKGVQFSPYSYIHPATDIQVQGSNLASLWASPSLTHWGTYDGSGDPIDLTFPNYWAKFVYNANFAAAPQISYNTIIGKGNMTNNVFSVYPTSSYITVEYHFPGFDPQYQGMDWTSLRLVFAYSGSQWYVVAIVHDQHTI